MTSGSRRRYQRSRTRQNSYTRTPYPARLVHTSAVQMQLADAHAHMSPPPPHTHTHAHGASSARAQSPAISATYFVMDRNTPSAADAASSARTPLLQYMTIESGTLPDLSRSWIQGTMRSSIHVTYYSTAEPVDAHTGARGSGGERTPTPTPTRTHLTYPTLPYPTLPYPYLPIYPPTCRHTTRCVQSSCTLPTAAPVSWRSHSLRASTMMHRPAVTWWPLTKAANDDRAIGAAHTVPLLPLAAAPRTTADNIIIVLDLLDAVRYLPHDPNMTSEQRIPTRAAAPTGAKRNVAGLGWAGMGWMNPKQQRIHTSRCVCLFVCLCLQTRTAGIF